MQSIVRALSAMFILYNGMLLLCAISLVAALDILGSEWLRAMAAAARRSANDIALLNDDEAARELASEVRGRHDTRTVSVLLWSVLT